LSTAPDELRRVVHSLTAEFEQQASTAGVGFGLAARRRPTFRGVEYGLVLEVWPSSGFDDYRLPAFRRSWLGRRVTLMTAEDLARHTRRILAAYVAGDAPPGPAFVVH